MNPPDCPARGHNLVGCAPRDSFLGHTCLSLSFLSGSCGKRKSRAGSGRPVAKKFWGACSPSLDQRRALRRTLRVSAAGSSTATLKVGIRSIQQGQQLSLASIGPGSWLRFCALETTANSRIKTGGGRADLVAREQFRKRRESTKVSAHVCHPDVARIDLDR
jgi:hypothetical protein